MQAAPLRPVAERRSLGSNDTEGKAARKPAPVVMPAAKSRSTPMANSHTGSEQRFLTLRKVRSFCIAAMGFFVICFALVSWLGDAEAQRALLTREYPSMVTCHIMNAFAFGLIVVLDVIVIVFAGKDSVKSLSMLLLTSDICSCLSYTIMSATFKPLVIQGGFSPVFAGRLIMWLVSAECNVVFVAAVMAFTVQETIEIAAMVAATLILRSAWMIWSTQACLWISNGLLLLMLSRMYHANSRRIHRFLLPHEGVMIVQLVIVLSWTGYAAIARADQQEIVTNDTAEVLTCLLEYFTNVSLVHTLVGVNSDHLTMQKLQQVRQNLTSCTSALRRSRTHDPSLEGGDVDPLTTIDQDVGDWLTNEFRLVHRPSREAVTKPTLFHHHFHAVATAMASIPRLKRAMTDDRVSEHLLSYNWDALRATPEECRGMLIAIFRHMDLMQFFDEATLLRFIREAETRYENTPYHNWRHAVTVTHALFLLIRTSQETKAWLSPLEVLAALVAAVCHDIRHHGVNNQYHVASRTELALMYNDTSVLENMHCRIAFEVIAKTKLLDKLSSEDFSQVRMIIIECILGTDMGRHKSALVHLRELNEMGGFMHLESDEIQRVFAIKVLMHSADLYNPWKPFPIAKEWAVLITNEFRYQADLERKAGLEPSLPETMLALEMDKLAKSQTGFVTVVLLPWWTEVTELFQVDFSGMIDRLNDNVAKWLEVAEELNTPASSPEKKDSFVE